MDHPDKSDPNPLYLEFNFNDLPTYPPHPHPHPHPHLQQRTDDAFTGHDLPYNAAAEFYRHFDAAQYMEAGANPDAAAAADDGQQQQLQHQYVYNAYGSYTIDMMDAADEGVGDQLQQHFGHEFKHESVPPPMTATVPDDDRIVVAQPRLIKQPVIVRAVVAETVVVPAVEQRSVGSQTRGYRRKEPHCRLRSACPDDYVFGWSDAIAGEKQQQAEVTEMVEQRPDESTPVRPSKRLLAEVGGEPPKSKKCLLAAMEAPEGRDD